MTFTEGLVIVGGLVLGYWIVASLFNKTLAPWAKKHSSDDTGSHTRSDSAQ